MDLHDLKIRFHELYADINGYTLSIKAQSKLQYYYNAHIYGEIDFDNFYKIISKVKPKENEVFYDLGSGTGKAVILAGLCFPFIKCIGIEKLDELYSCSNEIAKKMNNPNIEFVLGDFNNYNFSDGDVIYLNSYYFDYEMLDNNFLHNISSLKKGTRLIFVHTPLLSPLLEIIDEGYYLFSWGKAKVYISLKI